MYMYVFLRRVKGGKIVALVNNPKMRRDEMLYIPTYICIRKKGRRHQASIHYIYMIA